MIHVIVKQPYPDIFIHNLGFHFIAPKLGLEALIGKNILQVTKPCPGMRAAMASAKVGDDVYGEDPTTKLLEVFFIIVNALEKMS